MGSINLGYSDAADEHGDAGFATGPVDADSWYSGLSTAIPKGIWQGASAIGKMLPDNMFGTDEFGGSYPLVDPATKKKLWDDNVKSLDDWASNPYADGFASSLAKGAAKGLTEFSAGMLIGGPLGGAAVLGGAEGHDAYASAVSKGVDENTALSMGLVTGGLNAVTAVIPFKLGSIAEGLRLSAVGSDIAGNAATARFLSAVADTVLPDSVMRGAVQSGAAMVAQYSGATYINGEILRDAGYKELADQQDPFDMKMLAAQFVLGAAFHGLGRMGEKPQPSEVSAALDTLREGHIKDSAPTIPLDGPQAAAASDAINLAVEQVRRGEAVDIPFSVAAKTLESEAVSPVHYEPHATAVKLAAENAESFPRQSAELLPAADPVVFERPPKPEVEGKAATQEASPLSVTGESNLRFLEDNAPGHTIEVDGKAVKVSELRKHVDDLMRSEAERVKVYNVAAACALRNQGLDE